MRPTGVPEWSVPETQSLQGSPDALVAVQLGLD